MVTNTIKTNNPFYQIYSAAANLDGLVFIVRSIQVKIHLQELIMYIVLLIYY